MCLIFHTFCWPFMLHGSNLAYRKTWMLYPLTIHRLRGLWHLFPWRKLSQDTGLRLHQHHRMRLSLPQGANVGAVDLPWAKHCTMHPYSSGPKYHFQLLATPCIEWYRMYMIHECISQKARVPPLLDGFDSKTCRITLDFLEEPPKTKHQANHLQQNQDSSRPCKSCMDWFNPIQGPFHLKPFKGPGGISGRNCRNLEPKIWIYGMVPLAIAISGWCFGTSS